MFMLRAIGVAVVCLGACVASAVADQRACANTAVITTYPYIEDFESGFGVWQNTDGDDFDWDRYQGSTPSDNTGPDVDHTLGTDQGYYIYTESSGDNYPAKVAMILGPTFDLATLTSAQLSFWYHMAGDSVGSLYVEASGDDCSTWQVVFSRSGLQGYEWNLAVIDLSGFGVGTVSLRFRGITADGYESDMAIDDIYVGEAIEYDGGCCDLDTGNCLGLMTEAQCAAAGNTAWYLVTDCSDDNFCPQPPPANDRCDDATVISALPFYDDDVDYKWATPDVPVTCDSDGCDDSAYGVWYEYTPPTDCGARVTVSLDEGGANKFIAVFADGDCTNLTESECMAEHSSHQELTFDMAAETTYRILVGSFWCEWQPSITLDVSFNCSLGACCLGETCSLETVASCAALGGYYTGDDTECTPDACLYGACCASTGCEMLTSNGCDLVDGDFQGNGVPCEFDTCPPINETCATAIPIPDGQPAIEGNNIVASEDDDAEASCQEWSDKDVWFVYTATCTGTVTVDTEGSEQPSTVLSIWDDCGGEEIACDDSSGFDGKSYLTFDAVAGEDYYVRLASFFGVGGDYDINIVCDEAPQGACCLGDTCTVTYESVCADAGGTYGGDDSACGDDCNSNGVDDICDILDGYADDCNENGVPDDCDISGGSSLDRDGNIVPDECDPDCNDNGVIDACDLTCAGGCADFVDCGQEVDCQDDGVPDNCQLLFEGCDGERYDNGLANFIDGIRPDSGWAYIGIADDFTLDEPTTGTCFRFDIYDYADSGNLETMQVRIYANTSGLANLGSYWNSTPLFEYTYSTDDESLEIEDTGEDFAGFDLLRFLGTGPEYDLDEGHYAVHLTFPGTWDAGFWATAGIDDSDCAVYWGDWYDSPYETCAPGINMTQLSFALLGSVDNDCNANDVPDDCDIADGSSNDVNTNGRPDECECLRGDLNCDLEVNLADWAIFADCLLGPDAACPAECVAALLDDDDDIDLADFAEFQRLYMEE